MLVLLYPYVFYGRRHRLFITTRIILLVLLLLPRLLVLLTLDAMILNYDYYCSVVCGCSASL